MFQLSKKSIIHFTVLLAVALSAGWFLIHEAKKTGESLEKIGFISVQNTKKISEDGDILDTSKWKTYRNEEYGFEFKYPSTWNVMDVPSPGSPLYLDSWWIKKGDLRIEPYFGIGVSELLPFKSETEWYEKNVQPLENWEWGYVKKNEKNFLFVKQDTGWYVDYGYHVSMKSKYIVVLYFRTKEGHRPSFESYLPVFEQVVSSLSFDR